MIRHRENWILVLFVAIIAGLVAGVYAVETAFATTEPVSAVLGVDSDNDGLLDSDEVSIYFTDPAVSDTDGDGYSDGLEILNGYSPHHGERLKLMAVDSDEDYLPDAWELELGTGLMNPDSDGDFYLDGTEVAASFDPLNPAPVQLEKRIEVSTADLSLKYFMGEHLMGEIPVSTGKAWTPTPLGEFAVQAKIPVKYYAGPTWDYPNTKWNLQFTRRNGWGYYIHGAYWHDKFGREPVSGGCVNVRYEDMEPLYWWAQEGTAVIVY